MGMVGLLLAVALAGSQAAPEQAPPNPETLRSLMRWVECTARGVAELARRTTDAAEAVATATTEACRGEEDVLQQSMRAQYGVDAANAQMPMMRAYVRGRMMESISEARGGVPVEGEGNEVLVWGRCVRVHADELARGTASVEEIVAAALRSCEAQQRAARNAMTADYGEERAGTMMTDLLRETNDVLQRRIDEFRGAPR